MKIPSLFTGYLSSLVVFTKAQGDDLSTCGFLCETKAVSPLGLRTCLKNEIEFDPSVIVDDILNVTKLVFPSDGDAYDRAREANKNDMYPAAIVYAHSNEDVKKAINCAVENGHSASARGGNHNYQGLGSPHGYVVIDTRLMCQPDDFVIDRTTLAGTKHIFDQNVIATMKLQAGCTMGVLNAALDKYFDPSEGALTVYSACPSISIGGFVIGGGSADQTPYLGWGIDVLHEVDIILYDGTEVTASEEQNSDLFWALRGGGTGFGIVTDVTMKIVESPPPKDVSAERRFLWVNVQFDVSDLEKAHRFSAAFQRFLYDHDPLVSTKFGGVGVQIGSPYHFLTGHYLGSWQEFVEDWTDAGLFYEDFAGPDAADSALIQNYEVQTDHTLPPKGVTVREFRSYTEVWAVRVCTGGLLDVWNDFSIRRTFNACADLGIDDEFCNDVAGVGFGNAPSTFTVSNPDCSQKEVVDAVAKNGYDINYVINRSGVHPKYVEEVAAAPGNEDVDIDDLRLSVKTSTYHGALLPRLEDETFADIFMNVGFYFATHFQHGAPIMVPEDSTAFAHRNTGIMLWLPAKEYRDFTFSRILEDVAYEGDASKLQGYINYLGPTGDPNWRKFYFGDKYAQLQKVKQAYDPMDIFGKPQSIELPPPSNEISKKSGKSKTSKGGKSKEGKSKEGKSKKG